MVLAVLNSGLYEKMAYLTSEAKGRLATINEAFQTGDCLRKYKIHDYLLVWLNVIL